MPKANVPYILKQMRLDRLQPHPDQQAIRTITDEAKSGLSNFIGKVGLLEEIIFNKRTGHILSGHQRWKVLIDSGKKSAPVKVVDVDQATENMIFINMNNPEICGEFTDKTKPYLQSLKVELGDELYQKVGLEMLEVSLVGMAGDGNGDVGDSKSLAEQFGVPPFSVLDARRGYWQERKRAWIALGIKSELGRGGADLAGTVQWKTSPGGSPRPACDYRNRQRGDGRGRPIK